MSCVQTRPLEIWAYRPRVSCLCRTQAALAWHIVLNVHVLVFSELYISLLGNMGFRVGHGPENKQSW